MMQKWALSIVSVAAIVGAALSGCASKVVPNGFIDKSGALVIDVDKLTPKPVEIGDFSEGLAPVKFADSWGCISKTGEVVFTKPFTHISPFSEGMAAYSIGVGPKTRWGYINTNGETVIKPTFAAAKKFSEGLAPVRLAKEHEDKDLCEETALNGSWCFIDKTGKPVFSQTFQKADSFVQGLATIMLGDHMGAINGGGLMVIPAKYDMVYPADSGHVVAAQGLGLTGDTPDQSLDYYDQAGHLNFNKTIHGVTLQNLRPMLWVKSDPKTNIADLQRPLSKYASPGFSEEKSIGQVKDKFVIDQQFSARAFQGTYDYIFPVSGGYFVAYDDANGGKMDYRGGKPEEGDGIWNSTAFRFYDAAPFSDGMGLVQEKKDGPYGYIDKSGQYKIQPTFEHARSFHDGLALVGEAATHNIDAVAPATKPTKAK